MTSTLRSSETSIGVEPPIFLAKRASLRRFSPVSRMSRSMSCVVTGAPFSMLAELPMTMASSFAARRPRASARSVSWWRSEDVTAVLPAVDEDAALRRRKEQVADDAAQVHWIDLRQLRGETPARITDLP